MRSDIGRRGGGSAPDPEQGPALATLNCIRRRDSLEENVELLDHEGLAHGGGGGNVLVQVLGEEGEVAAPAADPEVGGDGLELQPGSMEGRGRRGSSCSRAAWREGPMQEGLKLQLGSRGGGADAGGARAAAGQQGGRDRCRRGGDTYT